MRWVGYQQAFLADQSAQKAVVKSRRIGFSEVVCYERACRAAGLRLLPGHAPRVVRPVPQNIISAGWEQSKDLLRRIVFHIEALQRTYNGKLIARQSATVVELTNGVHIRAFSSNPDTIRSFEGDVLIDEFSAIKRQEKVWAAASPMAKATLGNREGYKIVVVFTPLGDDNMAYEIVRGRMRKSFSVHEVDVHRAVRDGFPITVERDGQYVSGTVDDLREEIGDPDLFAQEYECSFLSASMRYIPLEVYDAATYYDEDLPSGFNDIGATNLYAGIDVARKKHHTALTRLARMGDINWHQFTDVERDMPWDEQEAWVDERIKICQRVAVDSTGIGSQFAERMQSRWPGLVEAINFSGSIKEVLATGLKLSLSRGKLRPRADDLALKREVLNMRRQVSELGAIRFLSPEEGGTHGDRAWSLALAESASGGAAVATGVPKVHTPTGQRQRTASVFEAPKGGRVFRKGAPWG